MPQVTINLPQDLLDYAADMVKHGECKDLSDLVRIVLQEDKKALERLWETIDEGERSGVSERSFEEIIESARERARSRAA